MRLVGSNPRGLWVQIPSGGWTFSEFPFDAKNKSCFSSSKKTQLCSDLYVPSIYIEIECSDSPLGLLHRQE